LSICTQFVAAQPEPGQQGRVAVDPVPKSIVFNVSFSPNGKQIALACEDKVIRIHDWPSGKQRAVLEGHTARVWMTAFSPNGKLLASCTGEYGQPTDPAELKLWDLETGKEMTTLTGHKGLVFSVLFAPDGKTLVSTGWDGTVRLWDVAEGKERAVLTDHQGPVRMAAFTPDAKSFATAGFDGTVRLWESATGKLLKTITAHERGTQWVALSPNGRHMATCDRLGGAMKLWDLTDDKELATLEGVNGSVLCVAFSPDGATLAACGGVQTQRGDVKLLEVASGKIRASFDGHKEWVECVQFAPGGNTLISTGGFTRGRPGEVRAWSVGKPQGKQPERLTKERLDRLWDRLADPDAAEAYQALLEMSTAPADAVPFLKNSLRPVEPPDGKTVAKLIADLDNDSFQVRERASRELEKLADLVRPALQAARAETNSAEVQRRTQALLKDTDFPLASPEQLRRMRAVEVLGWLATPEAKQVLQTLAKGAPGALLTEQARSSLSRLELRDKKP
jgi:dipeptidyl aminopeptidase/acylaminoacyl peptidase